MKINPDEKFITNNYEQTLKIIEDTFSKNHNLYKMIDRLGNSYATCPATTRKEYYSSFPGGLCYHNRHMYFWMKKFADMMSNEDLTKSLVKVAVLHEIGKVGDLDHEYYVDKDSNWHRERGIYFEVNPDIQFMKIPDRSIYLAQEFGVTLDKDEYLAILLHDVIEVSGRREEGYHYKVPKLATITQFAYRHSTQIEKANQVLWPAGS
jgi:hypothetical protein